MIFNVTDGRFKRVPEPTVGMTAEEGRGGGEWAHKGRAPRKGSKRNRDMNYLVNI